MNERTRNGILLGLVLFLVALLALWWYFDFSLEFMRFFAAEPDGRPAPTATPPPGCHYEQVQCIQAPCPPILVCPDTIVRCAPETQTVRVNQSATVTATGGTGAHEWLAPEGNPATGTGTQFSVAYGTPGTKKVTVQANRAGNSGAVDSVACTVIVNP